MESNNVTSTTSVVEEYERFHDDSDPWYWLRLAINTHGRKVRRDIKTQAWRDRNAIVAKGVAAHRRLWYHDGRAVR